MKTIRIWSISEDHAELKDQIKQWELDIDRLLRRKDLPDEVMEELELISHDMCGVNI